MQIPINFTVHERESCSTNNHLQANKKRFNKQCQLVYDYMVEHGSINPIQARDELGVMRLASRCCDLRGCGVEIESEFIKLNETQIKKYWIK